jgi:hypothetical protein
LKMYMKYPDNEELYIYLNYNISEYIRTISNDIYLRHNSSI